MNYEKIRAKLQGIEGTSLKTVENTNAGDLGAPAEYQEFLRVVGFGRIGNSQFQFFDGLVYVDEIFGYETTDTANFLIFGDDYQGVCTGFDRRNWSVVRILPNESVVPVADSFELFINLDF